MNETLNSFFGDADYKIPTTSNYMKFQEGKNRFRILSSAVTGYELWTKDNKPHRSREEWEINDIPSDVKLDDSGNPRINHFWAMVVYNYEAKRIQILQLTQKGIMKYIQNSLINDSDWGSPKLYDIVVTRTGSGFDTEYATSAKPHSEVPADVSEAYSRMNVDLEQLFNNGDPFKPAI